MNRDRLGKKGVGSPIEDTDLLYEYFPLRYEPSILLMPCQLSFGSPRGISSSSAQFLSRLS